MKKTIQVLVILSVVLSILQGGVCFGAPEPPALRNLKDPAERTRVQGLIEGARAEGKLVWVANFIEPQHAKYIADGFKAHYNLPNFSFEFTYAVSSQTVGRVEQMLQANRPTPDVMWYVAWAWYKSLLARGKLMRYDSPMYKEYTISHKVGNSVPGYWVSDSYTFSPMWTSGPMAKAGFKDFNPTSWWDFTDPKLAKLTSMGNLARSQSFTTIAIALRKALGDEWFHKVAKNKPALYIKSAQGRDWSASGEYPITLTSHAKNAEVVKGTGVAVKLLYPKEGVCLMPFAPVILAAAPHPQASKLFMDYVRSAPGTDRIAEAGTCLLYGRPGVKAPLKEFLPPAEEIKGIPMNWDVDDTEQTMKETQEWLVKIGMSY